MLLIIIIIIINLLLDELVADDDGSLDGVRVHDLGRVVQRDVGREIKLLVVDILKQLSEFGILMIMMMKVVVVDIWLSLSWKDKCWNGQKSNRTIRAEAYYWIF